jgi:hypothetical protein
MIRFPIVSWHWVAIVWLSTIACLSTVARGDRGTSSTPALTSEQIARIDAYVTAEMRREHIPGAVIGVYHRGQILMAKGYGLADVELNALVKPETLFESGSVGNVEGGPMSLGCRSGPLIPLCVAQAPRARAMGRTLEVSTSRNSLDAVMKAKWPALGIRTSSFFGASTQLK